MNLTFKQLQQIADSVGERSGWDFSRVRDARDPIPWDYMQVVRRYLQPTDHVLDVGTGGGERLLRLADAFTRGTGVDISPDMIAQALRNQAAKAITHIEFAVMDSAGLAFPGASFDVVLNRHSSIDVAEVVRVLRPGGWFITQQVGSRNTLNLLAAFGWTPTSFGPNWGQSLPETSAGFRQLGCRVAARAEYDVRYWFLDLESLLFWLKAVPLPEPFDITKHWQGVNRILQKCVSATAQEGDAETRIETNEHRELLIVHKPAI